MPHTLRLMPYTLYLNIVDKVGQAIIEIVIVMAYVLWLMSYSLWLMVRGLWFMPLALRFSPLLRPVVQFGLQTYVIEQCFYTVNS